MLENDPKEKIDKGLLEEITSEPQEVFLIVKAGSYEAVISELLKKGATIKKEYTAMDLILITANTDEIISLAEDINILKIASSKGHIEKTLL